LASESGLIIRGASTDFIGDGIHCVHVSPRVAPSRADLTQRSQTADRTSEQKDGANDQRERDQPINQADPYIPLPSVGASIERAEAKIATQAPQTRKKAKPIIPSTEHAIVPVRVT